MQLTVLVDNESDSPQLRSEWGASMHLRLANSSVLFDMGTTGLFLENARLLGVPVTSVDFAVLSHAHSDHGGGLARFLETSSAPVWASADMGCDLCMRLGPVKVPVGVDQAVLSAHEGRIKPVAGDTEVAPGVHLLVDIPIVHPLPRGDRLLMKRIGRRLVPDDFDHELLMVVEEDDGLVLLTGCSHHGVLNMVEAARKAFPGRPIKALIGGFHFMGIPVGGLLGDSRRTMRDVGERLRSLGVPRIVTMHCTQRRGYAALRTVLGPTIQYAGVGASLEL